MPVDVSGWRLVARFVYARNINAALHGVHGWLLLVGWRD